MTVAKKELRMKGILGLSDPPKEEPPAKAWAPPKPQTPAPPDKPSKPPEDSATLAPPQRIDIGSRDRRTGKSWSLSERAQRGIALLAWKNGQNESRYVDELLNKVLDALWEEVEGAYRAKQKMSG